MIKNRVKRMIAFILILLIVGIPVDASAQTYKTSDEVYRIIKQSLLAHKDKVTIKMSTKTMNKIKNNTDPIDTIIAYDDKATSKDSDYLKLSLSSWSESWTWSSLGSATLTFSAVYRTTLSQEKKLDTKIKSVLENLKLTNATDYQKVKAIHNYIIKRVSYDQTLEKHTAYHALINKSAVCEGYAAAAYRLLTDAGIECRVITGMADGGSHAWNIVKVDDQWYNLDLTWDDPITNTGEQVLRYTYFLKNEANFSDHTRDAEYSTDKFLAAYPIAEDNYKATK